MAVTINLWRFLPVLLGAFPMVTGLHQPSLAQKVGEAEVSPVFRSADDIPNLIFNSNRKKQGRTSIILPGGNIEQWDALKASISQNYGLNFSLAYTYVLQSAYGDSDLISNHITGSGAQAELDFAWTIFGRSGTGPKGVFGGKIESRHKLFNDNDPQSVAPSAGSIWTAASGYGLIDIAASQLWYEQHLVRDKAVIRVGKMSPFTMFDYYRYKSTRSAFLGQIQTFNPTIPFPPSTLGIAAGALLGNGLYAEAGVFDANGTPEDIGFNTLFGKGETFKIADFGWTPDFVLGGDSGSNDFHLTAWHIDKRTSAGTPEGWGVTASAQRNYGNVVPFIRYGYASGGVTQLEHFASAGFGIEDAFGFSDDVFGVSVGWGRPSNPQFRDQYSSEVFYRMQVTPNFAVTPNVQLILDPATDPTSDSLGVFSLRARLAL